MPALTMPSPFGPITLHEKAGEIVRVAWAGGHSGETPLLVAARGQVAAYFAGQRRAFDLPLHTGAGPVGDFLRALTGIPFGQTRTYGDLATALGTSAQAVGQMCGQNRLPILIPCHRVLGANGLGGFSAPGGVETKVALLRHEGAAGLLI